jgi:branched-chain amino acid transport system ATP-binding protein
MALLEVHDLSVTFGGLRAVSGFNLSIEPGQIRGLIGPNGAGKTTVFNLLTGIHRPTQGSVVLDGRNMLGLQPHQIAAQGIARTFQNLRLWRHMTALEHVKLARYSQLTYGMLGAFLGTPRRVREEEETEAIARQLMDLLGIGQFADEGVSNLPYGVQRKVEMARALAIKPKLLLLDEPTAGMNPEELGEMIKVIRQIGEKLGLAIFLIEHRLKVVMDLCQRVQTLCFGEVIAEGTPEEIRNDPKVIDAYLGREVAA